MTYLHIYIEALVLFWSVFATSKVLWALQRRRWHAEAMRRLVIE